MRAHTLKRRGRSAPPRQRIRSLCPRHRPQAARRGQTLARFQPLAAGFARKSQALDRVRRDVAGAANGLPGSCGAKLLSRRIRLGPAHLEGRAGDGEARVLIDINLAVMRGLMRRGRRMSGLVLKLSPKERVLINGAVIENGDRRSRKLSIMTPMPISCGCVTRSIPKRSTRRCDASATSPNWCCPVTPTRGSQTPDRARHRAVQPGLQGRRQPRGPRHRHRCGRQRAILSGIKALKALIPREDRLFGMPTT